MAVEKLLDNIITRCPGILRARLVSGGDLKRGSSTQNSCGDVDCVRGSSATSVGGQVLVP